MSTRTIVEINHDGLHRLLENPGDFLDLLRALKGSSVTARLNSGEKRLYWGSGIYVLAQRHHSETLKLEVK